MQIKYIGRDECDNPCFALHLNLPKGRLMIGIPSTRRYMNDFYEICTLFEVQEEVHKENNRAFVYKEGVTIDFFNAKLRQLKKGWSLHKVERLRRFIR